MSRFYVAIALSVDWHYSLRQIIGSLKKWVLMFLTLAVPFVLGVLGGPLVNSPPDINGFSPILSKELEFRIDDYKTGLVGRVVVYQNPNDPNEFVQVYYRQVAIVSGRPQEKNGVDSEGSNTNLSNLKYHNQQEAKVLGRVQQATDIFAYVQWWTVRDSRTGQYVKEGFLRSWLLNQNGDWVLSYGYDLITAPF